MTRVIVIGGGGAAVRAALAAAERGADVTVVSKGAAAASGCTRAVDTRIEFSVVNSPMPDPDAPSTYAADLESIGRGLKSPERVRVFAERSVDEVALLERLGVPLDDGGTYRRVQLAGSSHPRGIVCPPRFGRRVLAALWDAARATGRVAALERAMVVEILTAGGRAAGVLAVDLASGALRTIPADAVVLAAGGAGNVFSLTTNPRELTGDGYALATRAGAAVDHMEFVQYVMLTVAPIRGYFLLTSLLLRGALVDEGGARFEPAARVETLTPGEQKRRVIELIGWIARRKRAAPGLRVFWDGTALGDEVRRRMPRTCADFARRGHDLARTPVELDVGAHQFLGGVVTDVDARSTVANLFAAGDVADSVQGADRINGSGIMEALVFGAIAGDRAAREPAGPTAPDVPPGYARRPARPLARLLDWRRRLASLMDEILVVRDRARLESLEPMLARNLESLDRDGLAGDTPSTTRALHELRSSLTTALLVVRASLRREHDLGLFMTTEGR